MLSDKSGAAPKWETGPTSAELAAIEAEWPAIEAELDVLDQEIRALGVHAVLSDVTVRRSRRLGRAQLRALPTLAVGVPISGRSWGSEAA